MVKMNKINHHLLIPIFNLLVLAGYMLSASTAVAIVDKGFTVLLPGPLEIVACDFSATNGTVWALGMDFDPSAMQQESNYSIVRLNKNGDLEKYTTTIPVGSIVTPYRAKNQVRFFSLINNRYLKLGVKHLDGTLYTLSFDTWHPESKHETMTMRLKGNADAADIFLANDGSFRFVGEDHGLPYVVAISADKKTLFEKKGLGLSLPGKLKAAALLSDGHMLLAFNSYQDTHAGTALLVMLDARGEVSEQKRIEGIVVDAKPAGKHGAIILIAHDNSGKDMEAQALDSKLNTVSRYPVAEYFRIMDAAGQLLALNSTDLLSALIDRDPASADLVHLYQYSRSGKHEIATIPNPATGNLRAYNVSIQVRDKSIHSGTAAIYISGSNKGQKTYFIHSFPVH